jgi:type II secretory pathway pseudopilin PulG
MYSPFPSTRLRAALPAIALMEVLVAASILGLAAVAFLSVLRDAGADAAHARRHAQTSALALTLLQEARSSWRAGPHAGERGGMLWRRTCALSADLRGQRLALVRCQISIERPGARPFTIQSAFASPLAEVRQP